jgi:hypothetical protein
LAVGADHIKDTFLGLFHTDALFTDRIWQRRFGFWVNFAGLWFAELLLLSLSL